MKRVYRWLPVAWLCLAVSAGLTAEGERRIAPAAPADPHLRELIKQKQAFLDQLIGDSLAAARITASGNAEAQQFMGGARQQYMKAVGVLQSGDLDAANALLNESIWMMGMARRLVVDEAHRINEYRARYEQLLASIESLRTSYRSHLSRLGRSEDEDAGWRTVNRLTEQARALAGAQQLAEANRTLFQAESSLLAAFSSVLGTSTIDYTPRFSDAADEFRFEFERNRNYAELVPLAIAELKPSGDAVRLIARYVESDRAFRDRAQKLAANRNYREALNNIRSGTAELQRALAIAGLSVPQESADQ